MNRDAIYIAYLDGTLQGEEKTRFEQQLAASEEMRKELAKYREVFALENSLAEMRAELGAHFTVEVMEAIERESLFSRFFERYMQMSRKYVVPAAGFAAVVLCVMLVQNTNKEGLSLDRPSSVLAPENAREQSSDDSAVSEDIASKEAAPSDIRKRQVVEEAEQIGRTESTVESVLVDELADSDGATRNAKSHSLPPSSPSGTWGATKDDKQRLETAPSSTPKSATSQTLSEQAEAWRRFNETLQLRDRNRSTTVGSELKKGKRENALEGAISLEEGAAKRVFEADSRASGASQEKARAVGGGADTRYATEGPQAYSDIVAPPPAGYSSGEGYGQYAENQRILVSQEPVSTFGLDVDTGSYTNARRYLKMGQLPPSDAIRIEEFINYFDYEYPSSSDKSFSVHYEIAPSPFSKGRHLLKLGVKAKELSDDSDTPWNLVFLVDVSGSMAQQNKLPLVQSSLKYLASNMRPQDRIAIVTYASGSRLVLDSTSAENKAEILAAIDKLNAGGGTNGSGGIQLAYEIAARNRIANGVNRVVLATDGDFNVGISDFNGLMSLIEAKRKEGTTLTSLGFGVGNYQEKNLEQLANRGNGNYFYVDSFEEARRIFGTELAATMQMVAKDVKVQIEFNPAQVLEYRLVGYDNRKLRNRDFNDDTIDAGDIGAGHTVTAFYEIVLADSPIASSLEDEKRYAGNKVVPAPDSRDAELGFVKFRFKAPSSDTSTLESFALDGARVKAEFAQASSQFKAATAVVGFAQILRRSHYRDAATLAQCLEILKPLLGANEQLRELYSLMELAKALHVQSVGPAIGGAPVTTF